MTNALTFKPTTVPSAPKILRASTIKKGNGYVVFMHSKNFQDGPAK